MKKALIMNKFILVVLLSCGLCNQAFANNQSFQKFIPKGFKLTETHCQADFNKDGKKDCVLLIKDTKKSAWEKTYSGDMVDRNRRGIVILFKTNQGYQKVLENKALFASENEDGGVYFAPELEIEAEGNKLIFYYGHGRYGSWQYLFDYRTIDNDKDFYLIGYDLSSNHGPYIEYTHSVNFLTHKFRHQENMNTNQENDVPNFKTTWHTLSKAPIQKLSQIDDIDDVGSRLSEILYHIKTQ
ncbi:hypothetical protein A9Z63_00300 [Moraxella lacunata]|uniref:FG-GAP repeat n=2 Tax=Moraxella lacunata TaxID=477 RepID=A0A1B8Q625_MORLA|nr:hypothetical protein A9Z63_00300 [Moraxella lacunata]OBX65203.1 hypothetical protein A9309_03700 [Moraxella lacunata]